MAKRQVVVEGALTVEGLSETLRALARIDKTVAKASKDVIREHTKPIAQEARKVSKRVVGAPSRTSWIGWSITNKGAAITLRASVEPRALQTEFGADWHQVGFDENVPRRIDRMRSRPSPRPDPQGHVIQPTIKRMLPDFLEAVETDLAALMSRELDRAGVPRGT